MNIVIVEDSHAIRLLLRSLVQTIPGAHVAGMAAGEEEAIALIEREQPDVVLLDLTLAPGYGFNVLKAVRAADNPCKVLVLTNQNAKPLQAIAADLGADGLYDKTCDLRCIVRHIESWSPAGV